MQIVLLNDWGYGESHPPHKEGLANASLKRIAVRLVYRLNQNRARWYLRQSFKRYFTTYNRNAHGKTYPNMFSKNVQNHVWSFAVYMALNVGYNIEELKLDWESVIGGTNGIKKAK